MSLSWIVAVSILIIGFALIAIVWAPWRDVRDEPPLAEDVETRLLLGEDPEELAAELEQPAADDDV